MKDIAKQLFRETNIESRHILEDQLFAKFVKDIAEKKIIGADIIKIAYEINKISNLRYEKYFA